jgi:glycosyltransferase involved in cell wall biosynthesis
LEVAVYTPLNRLAIPSGVPRHIIEVVGALLRDPSLHVSFLANAAEAEKYLPSCGQEWTDAPRTSFSRPVSQMSRLWGLINWPSFEAMGGRADWLYLPADAYVPAVRAKLAITIHDVYKLEPPAPGEDKWEHYKARLRYWVIYKQIAAHADSILTVSQFSADRIMHHLGVPASKIQVVHNGVSPDFFQPDEKQWPQLRASLGLADSEPFFVYVGGLKAKKNGGGIIATWREFERRRREGRLVILGHHDSKMLEVARRELSRALFPSRMDDCQMAALLSQSSALFFPSFYEGFGIPIVEAMAAGTLCVLSDIPPFREIAGDVAFYSDPSDPSAMASRLEEILLLGDVERVHRLRESKAIASNFTWDQVTQHVREIFK